MTRTLSAQQITVWKTKHNSFSTM